ncbi:MAG: hypothetical protein QNK24_10340 [Desulfuromusa sp.]|nr:hypothetical protein [Desulfuromusa sp.]
MNKTKDGILTGDRGIVITVAIPLVAGLIALCVTSDFRDTARIQKQQQEFTCVCEEKNG